MTGPSATIVAQAKLNLHLRVLAREASGYHTVETIFHRIDLGDDVAVHITDGYRSIDVSGGDTGPAESNLALRAATAYAERAGWPRGFRIELSKRIAVGAGMGGGSADAAAVLRLLESLAPKPMGAHTLLDLSASLGADIPFLASDAVMALAWGRGGRLLSLPPLPRMDVLLMTPAFSVSTEHAYAWLDDDRAAPGGSAAEPAVMMDPARLGSWRGIAEFARNDFEPVIVARHPELGPMLARLRQSRALLSGMTGSGSTIFGVLDGPADFAKVPAEHRSRVQATTSAIDVVQPLRIE